MKGVRRFRSVLAVATAALLPASCSSPDKAERLTVFAAASLREVLLAIAAPWEEAEGVRIDFNFAGSGTLANQILAAPRGDLFLSANVSWMDRVAEAGAIRKPSRVQFCSNQLAVIAHPSLATTAAGPLELAQLPIAHLAIGDPASVPAGSYARQWLQSVEIAPGRSLWNHFESRIAPGSDVRAVLAMVAARHDLAGIVYRSDHAAMPTRTRLLFTIPVEEGPPIHYVAAILTESPHPEAAARFLHHLRSPEAAAVFARHGFAPPTP